MTALETLHTSREQHSNRQSQLTDRQELWDVVVAIHAYTSESLGWTQTHCNADLHLQLEHKQLWHLCLHLSSLGLQAAQRYGAAHGASARSPRPPGLSVAARSVL